MEEIITPSLFLDFKLYEFLVLIFILFCFVFTKVTFYLLQERIKNLSILTLTATRGFILNRNLSIKKKGTYVGNIHLGKARTCSNVRGGVFKSPLLFMN